MLKAIYLLDPEAYALTYLPAIRAEIAELVEIGTHLHEAQVVLSGRGCPKLDQAFLNTAPNLRVIFFGKGSVKGLVTDAFWERGITLVGANSAMAVAVAEYALSQILFSLKQGWQHALAMKQERVQTRNFYVPGTYGTTVGVVSLSQVGRRVCELLGPFDMRVIAYDPYVQDGGANGVMDVSMVSLEALFAQADVVTLHAPLLPATRGMVTRAHLASMKPNATLINTARGGLIQQDELIEVLRQRPDLFAVLDVTEPEPLPQDSPLFEMPNVVLTPHIAGPLNHEYARMGHLMADELRRYINGESLHYQITRERADILA